jgi:hypothetical protein
LATFAAPCADNVTLVPELLWAINRKTPQATEAESRILSVDMAPPRESNQNESAFLDAHYVPLFRFYKPNEGPGRKWAWRIGVLDRAG